VDTLLDQIDDTTYVVEAIRNPDYGTGVVAASLDNGILTVLRITESTIDVLGTAPSDSSWISCVKFDTGGTFNEELFVATGTFDLGISEVFRVSPQGSVTLVHSLQGDDSTALLLAFSSGAGGYQPGAYLINMGRSDLYFMDGSYGVILLEEQSLPTGREDVDIRDLGFAPLGMYGSNLIMADSDPNNERLSVIYELLPDLTWQEITTPVSTNTRFWGTGGLAMSPGGAFESNMYVADSRQQEILLVDELTGNLSAFASGFSVVPTSHWSGVPFAISVSDNGEHMFVSDDDGVHRIRSVDLNVGPTLAMREPWVEHDDVHTGPAGVDSLRLLWSDEVVFDSGDVSVTDEAGQPVPHSVTGSNSQFMVIAFGAPILNDTYTITVHETVVSAETGAAIDGDDDGVAGGDAILTMKHRLRHNSDNDSDVDMHDFQRFQQEFSGPS
jgi:hypothetical protein